MVDFSSDYSFIDTNSPTFNGFSGSGGSSAAGWGQLAQFAPQIGNTLGNMFGGQTTQEQGKSFIPMTNAQIAIAKMVNPILDSGIARQNGLYERLIQGVH